MHYCPPKALRSNVVICRGVGLLERHTSSSVDSVENLEQAEVLHINQSADLIQPSEVQVNDTMVMVERAEPVLSNQGECARSMSVRNSQENI